MDRFSDATWTSLLLVWARAQGSLPFDLIDTVPMHFSRVSAPFISLHLLNSSSFTITSIFEILTLFHIHYHSVFSTSTFFSPSAFFFLFSCFGLLSQRGRCFLGVGHMEPWPEPFRLDPYCTRDPVDSSFRSSSAITSLLASVLRVVPCRSAVSTGYAQNHIIRNIFAGDNAGNPSSPLECLNDVGWMGPWGVPAPSWAREVNLCGITYPLGEVTRSVRLVA
jgi:hypothetical protein